MVRGPGETNGSLLRLILSCCWVWAALQGCGGEEEWPDVDQQSWAVHTVCGGNAAIQGIDVSKYQGTVNWQSVKGAGNEFAFARVSDGLKNPDGFFTGNWTGMKQAGIVRGAYQYFRPDQDALAQAQLLIQAIQNAGGLDSGDLPPLIDVETTTGTSASSYTAKLDIWINAVQQAFNRKPIIYSGSYFWDSALVSSAYASYPLWVPNYTTKACPTIPSAWSEWKFWQYSDKGSVAGVSGNVDLNKFNGTLTDLQALIASSSTTPPAPPPTPPPSDQPPKGQLEGVSCQGIVGWTHDPDNQHAAVQVRIYIDLSPDQGPSVVATANVNRPDLCGTLSSCNHAFSVPIPKRFLDGKPHQVQVGAVNTNGAGTSLLGGGPRSFTCATPSTPGKPSTPPGQQPAPARPAPDPGSGPDPGTGSSDVLGGCSMGPAGPSLESILLPLLLLGLACRRRRP